VSTVSPTQQAYLIYINIQITQPVTWPGLVW